MAFNIDSILGKSRQSALEERTTPERSFGNSGEFSTNHFYLPLELRKKLFVSFEFSVFMHQVMRENSKKPAESF